MGYPKLNFTENFDFKIRKDKDNFFIYDPCRKSWLLLTPEEWVRQHWIHHFLRKNYAPSAIITEKKILLNGTVKRIDILITEKTLPVILVECKAPSIKITEKVFDQTARYNSVIGAGKILLSNGLHHIGAKFIENRYEFFNFDF